MKKHLIVPVLMTLLVFSATTVLSAGYDGPWGNKNENYTFSMRKRGQRFGNRYKKFNKRTTVTPEQEEAFLNELKELDPKRYDKLIELKDKNPRIYNAAVRKGVRRQNMLEKLKEKDPETYKRKKEQLKLSAEVRRLSKKYREAKDDNEKSSIEEELRQKLDKLYDLRHEDKISRVEKLRKRLEDMEKELSEREKNREEIINRKLEEITGKSKIYRW